MRQVLIGLVLLTFISCGKSEFCGQPVDYSEFSNLKDKVDGNGFSVGIQLSLALSKEFGDNSGINFEIDYSVLDTLVLNVINIPDENSAKKISCMIHENSIVKETKTVYAKYYFEDTQKSFKY